MPAKLILLLVTSLSLFSITTFGIEINTTLDGTVAPTDRAYRPETGVQTGRLNRNGTASTCGSVKPTPTVTPNTGSRQYDEYGFVALSAGCVTVTLSNAGNNLLFSAAYNVSGLNAGNPSSNYLADAGSSPITSTPSRSFSFDVVAGQVFNVVVHEVNEGGGVGQSYTLDVSGVKLEPDVSTEEVLDVDAPQLNPAYSALTGNQTGRLNRFNPASSCGTPKPNPGVFSSTGSRRRDTYRFIPATSGCAIVSLSHTGADQAHVIAYDENGFDPNATSDNYLADSGNSANNQVRSFSFIVQRGVPFDLVVHEVNPGAGVGANYTLNISNVKLAPNSKTHSKLDANGPVVNVDYTSSTGTQTPRLSRNAIPSSCAAPKANPGTAGIAGARRFDSFLFTPATSGCVEVKLRNTGANNIFSVAYNSAGFDPNDPDANYLADMGSSITSAGQERSYSFNVTAGVPFSIAVHETNPGGAPDAEYELSVSGIALDVAPRAAPFDFDGDCKTDVSIFRPGPGEWWFLNSIDGGNTAFQFGQGSDTLVPADYTGDGVVDVAFFRPSIGEWFVLRSEDQSFFSFPFGANGDIPAPGDFDGDGIADPTVFRPSTANWFTVRSTDGGFDIRAFGANGDRPVVSDYDGDGLSDLAIYRPSGGEWWLNRTTGGLAQD